MFRDRKLMIVPFSVACLVSVVVCVIVNIAIDRRITWAAYPILSVPFGWLIISPLIIKRRGIALSLLSLTFFILPFLFFMERITAVGNWFAPLGIPSAVVGTITIWIIYLLFRFLEISLWYKSAITVSLVGVVANLMISYYVDIFLYGEPRLFNTAIRSIFFIFLSVIISIHGHKRDKEKST